MFKRNVKIYKIIFILGVFFILFPLFAKAEVVREKLEVEILGDFVLEPAKNEVFVDPGQISDERISITNRMGKTASFKIELEDIVGSDDVNEQIKLLGNERGPYSLKDFVIPEVTEFTLAPGEKITIPVKVNIPMDIEPRGYYGAIIVSSSGEQNFGTGNDGAQGTTKLVTRLGSIFLVRVNGEVIESSSLWDFKTIGPKKIFYAEHPEGFEVAVKNDGTVHLVHYGEIKIKNILGKEVASMPVNAFFSLPDSTRYGEIKWPTSFSFGYYRAEINLYPGYADAKSLNNSISFVVLPWKIMIPALLAVIVLILILRFLKNNFKIERKS